MLERYEKLKCLHDTETGSMSKTLSPKQWAVFGLLLDADGGIVGKDEILNVAFSDTENFEGVTDMAIGALIRRLRERLMPMDTAWEIVTLHGWGWRLVEHLPSPPQGTQRA